MSEETEKLRTYFTATFFFALFFWAWAVKNTVGMDNLDLGVVSFGSVLVSSGYMLGALTAGSINSASKLLKKMTTCTQVFVALNYLLGAFIGFTVLGRPGFSLYCVAFAGIWLAIAYYGHTLMNSVILGGETLPLSG